MKYEEWKEHYHQIIKDMKFLEEKDIEAARILSKFSSENGLIRILSKKLKGKRVNIFGAGPSLGKIKKFSAGVNISADGATSFLLENKIIPDVVVTDLDGNLEDILKASEFGSIIVVHAHGDNIPQLEYVSKFKQFIGTTQIEPFDKIYNFGGFTDGDRAVFLAEHFGARKITLYGFDFKGESRYSPSPCDEKKRKKFSWAKRLIEHMKKRVEIGYG